MENETPEDRNCLSFTYDEILAKLEAYRSSAIGGYKFTAEQDKVILRARDIQPNVSWRGLSKFFADVGWGKIGAEVFTRRYEKLKAKD